MQAWLGSNSMNTIVAVTSFLVTVIFSTFATNTQTTITHCLNVSIVYSGFQLTWKIELYTKKQKPTLRPCSVLYISHRYSLGSAACP